MKKKNMGSFFLWVGETLMDVVVARVKSGESGVMEYHSFSTFFGRLVGCCCGLGIYRKTGVAMELWCCMGR